MTSNIFEDARRKRAELAAAFEELPVITIHGVIGATGAGGNSTPPDTHWSLNLGLIAWRIHGAPVQASKLIVTRTLSKRELTALQGRIRAESLIAFRGKLCAASPFGDARAQLVELLPPPVDGELDAILFKFKEPVFISDAVIGTLVLNRTVDWFEGKIEWLGKDVEITIARDEDGSPSGALQTAKALLAAMHDWSAKVNAFAVKKLLELKNDNWLGDDETTFSADQFIRRMTLVSISAYPDGSFEFWHDDGDLFWGHSIQVSGSLADGLTDADIPG